MPIILPLYNKLKENTQKLPDTFSLIAGLFDLPAFPILQGLVKRLGELGIPFLPGEELANTQENKHILTGALLFHYFYPSNDQSHRFLTDALCINTSHQPDAYTIVMGCSAYYFFLMNTFPATIQETDVSGLALTLRSILGSIVELTEKHRPAAQAIHDQLDFIDFIQSVEGRLNEFSEEANTAIEALAPLVDEQFKVHDSLDYFDTLACLNQIKVSDLMRHVMEEYFIPNQIKPEDWSLLIRYQVDLCSQDALAGAYVLVAEQAKHKPGISCLQDTLHHVLTELQFNEAAEKKPALGLLCTFIYLSDTFSLDIRGWPTLNDFVVHLNTLCDSIGAGIRHTRQKELVLYDILPMYYYLQRISLSTESSVHPFRALTSGEAMGQNKCRALINRLRTNNEPLVRLLEGLLVEGRIPVMAEETDDPHAYWEQRTHDAIRLYAEAARDRSLRELVDYLLWEIKTTSTFASVQERLSRYDLSPSPRYTPGYAGTGKQAHSLPPVKSILFFKPEPLPVTEETEEGYSLERQYG